MLYTLRLTPKSSACLHKQGHVQTHGELTCPHEVITLCPPCVWQTMNPDPDECAVSEREPD